MKKTVLMAIMGCVLLSGCGVSQEDYDKLEKKNKQLSAELEEQKEACASLEERNKSMSKKIDEQLNKDLELATPTAWAQTYFGDDCLVFSTDGEYVQIISKESYIATSDGIQTIYKKVLESMQGLRYVLDNWEMKYERIGVRFQQSDGTELIEFVFKKQDETYGLESIAGNLQNSDIINATFNNMF